MQGSIDDLKPVTNYNRQSLTKVETISDSEAVEMSWQAVDFVNNRKGEKVATGMLTRSQSNLNLQPEAVLTVLYAPTPSAPVPAGGPAAITTASAHDWQTLEWRSRENRSQETRADVETYEG
ncbi:hypothetical protein GALMADRAFT_144633 [Galerina marginata CBS 339.88]|uniref:Uncharacterized protein n=1 Tax=Galerina marginata (strain CBS 339.88) TaxID=685588 RepID=A0A067SRI9_GALM3|nr:hypothetical protein GALMADRAFT_144633 [Galerina marginata CBS 339.88]